MAEPKKGRKLAYVELLRSLDQRELYSHSLIVQFALEKGFVKPAEDDNKDKFDNYIITPKELLARLSKTIAQYLKRMPSEDCEYIEVQGRLERAWFGCQLLRYVLELSPQEDLVFDLANKRLTLDRRKRQVEMAQEMRRHQKEIADLGKQITELEQTLESYGPEGTLPLPKGQDDTITALMEATAKQTPVAVEEKPSAHLMPRGRKTLLAVAIFGLIGLVASGSAAMMGLSPFEILRQFGLAAAKEELASAEAKTPEGAYQQCWMAYHEGEYDKAIRGIYAILAEQAVSRRMQADCFYLLGSIKAATGDHDLALSRYFEAYEGYAGEGAIPNLFQVALAIAFEYSGRVAYTEIRKRRKKGHPAASRHFGGYGHGNDEKRQYGQKCGQS